MSNVKPGHLDHPVEVHRLEGGPLIGSMADTREHGEPVHVCRKLEEESPWAGGRAPVGPMADTEDALERVSQVGTSPGPREGALGWRTWPS